MMRQQAGQPTIVVPVSPQGGKGKGNGTHSQAVEIPVPEWFADPNHRAKSVGSIMFELIKNTKGLR